MKIFFLKLTKNRLLWALSALILSEYAAYCIFKDKDTVPILAAISTGLVVMFGYFATHYSATIQNQREKKFEQCLQLIKKIRFFILESNLKETEQQRKMRDELQDAYFAFSLLTSAKSYEALSEMMKAFKIFLENQSKLPDFQKAQSKFINKLRDEFFIDKEINFETYDFKLKDEE